MQASAARAIKPVHDHFDRIEKWESTVFQRITALSEPWALDDHFAVSVMGFARIARLHDLSTGEAPFSPETGDLFQEELGNPVSFHSDGAPEDREAAALDSGMNPETMAFPPSVYPHVLISAGFQFRVEDIQTFASEGGDQSGVFDSKHAVLLRMVEHRLRETLETELKKVAGKRWYKTRVPGEIWQRWKGRQEIDQSRRGDSYPIIFYSDFADFSTIICRKDNWNDSFRPIFSSKQDIQVSISRLAPIRNAIAHSRPLVRSDQLTLFSEGLRIRVYAEVCGLILAFLGSGGRNAATIFSLRKSSSR